MEYNFKKTIPKEERKRQCNILLLKNPNKIPIILEKDPKSKIKDLQKSKFLIQKDFTFTQFIQMIRGLLKIPEYEALFFIAKGKHTISGNKTMGQIYDTFHDKEDGFLYIIYSSELIYG